MNIKNTIIKHYKKFFDLHAKGITLDEDDHLNIDWAEDLVKNCSIPAAINRRELLIDFILWYNKEYPHDAHPEWLVDDYEKSINSL